ncbi:hypothetical protein FQN57_006441 [Myotisia sp. PD_48]|nr:hypothetical protein FQN57_006441 [Myotisia sp. PD_48]
METAIRWSPSSTAEDQRFLYVDIPGKQFNLCKVTSRDRKRGTLNYEIQASRQSVPPFQAFDWSPADEKLVVVGQSSGEAAVLRLDDDSQPIVLPLRNQRACNAVAFNTQGLLATGLDKVRNDFSLNIWNIHQRLPLANVGRSFNSTRNPIEPYRKLASSERITSVKFFKDQPEVLVAGVTGQYVRIYDLRGMDPENLHMSRHVFAVYFRLLMARRIEASGSPSLQFSTRCVHNLAIDWLDENYIASCYPQREASICVWDRRSGFRYPAAVGAVLANADSGQLGPALELKPTIDSSSSICSLRFSRTRRGCLGMLSTKGNFKCYDIAKEYMSDEYRTSLEHALGGNSSKHYAEQIYTKKVSDFRPTAGTPDQTANPESLRVTSFDFLNTTLSSQPLAITLSTEKTVSLFSPPSPSPCIDISPTCTISCASTIRDDANSSLITPTSFLGMKAGDLNQILSGRSFVSSIEDTNTEATNSEKLDCVVELSSRGKRERLFTAGKMNSISDALTKLTIPRLRCLEGYLLDSEKNKSVLADDPSLQELWSWIGRARSYSAGDSMIVHGVDMNYLGICNIWNGNFGRSHSSRTHGSHPSDYANINGLLQEIVRKLKLAEGKTCVSAFPEKRQLCLHACGVPESIEDLKSQIDQLVTEKLHTKAAALAILQDEPKLAYTALRENKPTQAHKLLAMAIIGASKGDTGPEWQETCDEIAAELTDPYARAILALVSKGNWKSVIQETTLPLKYRVEVALRWLPDDELTTYLEESTTEATRQGDIEGIILTGLDHGGLDLFQSYINKFHDVQTPVLAMCHTVPRFIADAPSKRRFEAWRETYRQQMNSWKLHLNRVKFDVESRKLAMTWEGRRLVEPPLQQISLVCNYCTRPLSQQDALNAELSVAQTAGPEFMHPTAGHPLGPSLMGGTVCPKCSRHMPRCGICSLWLGSPDPRSKAAIAEDAKKSAPSKHDATDIMKRFIVFCIQCNHGFHADHARDWFVRHRVCPVAECNCICDR